MAFKDTVRRVGQIIGIFAEEPSGYSDYDQDEYDDDDQQDDGYGGYAPGYATQPQQQQPQRAQRTDFRQQTGAGRQQQVYGESAYAAPRPQPASYGRQQDEPVQQPTTIFGNQRSKRPPDNVVNFARGSGAEEGTGRKHSEIILCVRRLEDCQEIIDALLDGKSLFLNLENLDDVQMQRVIDMLGGASFALRGTIAKISHRTYLVAPSSVDVVNEQVAQTAPKSNFAAFQR